MRNFLIGLMLMLPVLAFGAEKNTLVLKKENTIAFRDVVTYRSIKAIQEKVFKMSAELSPSTPIYLFLDTPGGSIDAGMEMINALKAIPQEVKTITNFSASMGFITVQSLGERLILPNGTLMSHRARGGEQGQIPGEFDVRAKYMTEKITKLSNDVAKRLGMEPAAYEKLILNEYWVDGEEAVKAKMADKVVMVTCSKEMMGTYKEEIQTFLGAVKLTWSECPIITSPEVDFSGLDQTYLNEKDAVLIKKMVLDMVYNKRSFIREYLESGVYDRLVH